VGVAHHLVAFGWGVDLVVAKGAVLEHAAVEALTGEHWTPRPMRARGWRVPMAGTLAALEARHRAFLKRIQGESWTPPPPLTCFRRIGYRRPTETAERAWAAFALRRPLNPDRYSSFDPVTETTCVAARLRHAAHVGARASKAGEWSESRIASFVVGHAEGEGDAHIPVGKRRFAYLPLPTLVTTRDGGERVGEIRRAILTTFADDCDDEVGWAKRSLSGSELVDERSGEIVAALETIEDDAVVSRYSPPRGEASWASVTPVVLPGHDDPDGYRRRIRKGVSAEEQKKMLARIDDRIESLLRKAIEQAGFSEEMARYADLDWRRVGYWRGADHVSRYRLPKHLERLPRFHVRILWRDAHGRPLHVRGPVCLGGGRFYGFGLCATLRERDVAPELSRTPTLGNKPSHTGDTLASERSGQE
jgi:CRISPR-associated protein Csb2